MSDITMKSMYEVSKMIKDKKISSVELVDACLKRTDQLKGTLNPYITLLADQAKEDAKKAQAEIDKNGPKSPMHGIPIAQKDMFYTKNVLTTAGSAVLKDFIPDYDSTVTLRLKEAGSITMGKTNTHEWAFGTTGDVSYYGPSHNPWDPERITGGSSCGSGAAVASGMVYLATGTDTGGSVRIPSALCGVVGYKPTYGLVSLYGVIPLSLTLDHPGPIARSVMDAAITMDMITGTDPFDPCLMSIEGPPTNFAEQIETVDTLRGVKLGVPKNYFFDKTDYSVEDVFKETVKQLETLGAVVEYIEIPYIDDVFNVSSIIMYAEAAWYHKKRIVEHPELFQPAVLDRLTKGMDIHVTEYVQAMQDRNRLISLWKQTLKGIDAVIAPTVPMPAFKIGSTAVMMRGNEEVAQAICAYHTRLGNILGAPSLTVPNGMVDGLPTGLMFIGKSGDDKRVLEIGYAFEKHHPFKFMQY